jgi:multidrug efflux pump subunit AcrA (membrane-fusion protein)
MLLADTAAGVGRTVSRPAAALAAVSLALFGCSSKQESAPPPTVTVQVATAEEKPIQDVVNADAVLYPREQAAIVPKISAPVKKFYVQRGSKVRAGQLLAELEDRDLAGAVTENQGGYQQAEANYATAAQKAQQDLVLAKQQLDAQQKIYDNRLSLLKQGAVSQRDVTEAQIALTQARDQYQMAQKQFDLQAAEGQLKAAKGKSTSAAAQLGYARIVSPLNGVVTDRPIYPGETAPSGAPILTVMDLSQVIARAHIAQQEAADLKAGDPARISVPGQSEDFPGKVTLVSPALDPNSTTVEVWVQATNPGGKLKPGSSVRVAIVSETVPKALVVPVVSILTGPDGAASVFTLDASNKPIRKAVKVGIRTDTEAQITEGLSEGERVITVGAFELDKEDEPVLAKTKILVEAPKASEAAGSEK